MLQMLHFGQIRYLQARAHGNMEWAAGVHFFTDALWP